MPTAYRDFPFDIFGIGTVHKSCLDCMVHGIKLLKNQQLFAKKLQLLTIQDLM